MNSDLKEISPYAIPLNVHQDVQLEHQMKLDKNGTKLTANSLNSLGADYFDESPTTNVQIPSTCNQPNIQQHPPSQPNEPIQNSVSTNSSNAPKPNWPSACCPLIHHNIDMDIPEHHRSLMRIFFFSWKLTFLGLVLNFISIVVSAFDIKDHDHPPDSQSIFKMVFHSFLVAVTSISLTFLLGYKSVYRRFSLDPNAEDFGLGVFVMSHGGQALFAIRMMMGLPWNLSSPSGYFFLKSVFGQIMAGEGGRLRIAVFLMAFANTFIWSLVLVTLVVTARGVYVRIFRAKCVPSEEIKEEQVEI